MTLFASSVRSMAAYGPDRWFLAHRGAARIAGTFLQRSGAALPPSLCARVEKELPFLQDDLVEVERRLQDQESGTFVEVQDRIVLNARALRNSGHGSIYGALALRAIREIDGALHPSVYGGLSRLFEMTRLDELQRYYGVSNYDEHLESARSSGRLEVWPSLDLSRLAVKAFEALDVIYPDTVIDGRRYFFTGELIHIVTMARACSDYAFLGHEDIALQLQQRCLEHIALTRFSNVPLDPIARPKEGKLLDFDWEQARFNDPHVIKLLYAYEGLQDLVPEDRRDLMDRNGRYLLHAMIAT